MSGVEGLVGLGLNCRWPGFGSTQREAAPWSTRLPKLVRGAKAAAPQIICLQESGDSHNGGQQGEFFAELGEDWHYQAYVLNGVGWLDSVFEFDSVQEVTLPKHGQYPGRSAITVKLRHRKSGARIKVGSTHYACRGGTMTKNEAAAARATQAQKTVATVNDDEDDWPCVLEMDSNNPASNLGGSTVRAIFQRYGWRWPRQNGIDLAVANYGAVIDSTSPLDFGNATDHHGVHFAFHTTRE